MKKMWRPIETAPKTGEGILIYSSDSAMIEISHWGNSRPHSRRGEAVMGWCTYFSFVSDEYDIAFPTHWMPLPKIPD